MTSPTPPNGEQARQLLARVLDIKGLSAEHRVEIESLMEQAGRADAGYQSVLDTGMGDHEFGRHLADLLRRGEHIVAQYHG